MEAVCVAPTSCLLGMAPLWSPSEGYLWWTDQRRAKLHRYNPRTGNTRRYDLPLHVSAMALAYGQILMAGDGELGLYDPETEDYERLTTVPLRHERERINDGACAADGSFWFASCDDDGIEPFGQYFRLSGDGTLEATRLDPVTMPYTFAFSPDSKTFYTCDSENQEILACDIDAQTGVLSERRVFASTMNAGCYPNGSAIDVEGYLWSAQWAGSRVVRYAPDGRIDQIVKLPVSRPTHCSFGGADMKTLFITTARIGLSDAALDKQPLAGCLFALATEAPGLPSVNWGRGAI